VRTTTAPYTKSRLAHLVRNKSVGFTVVEQYGNCKGKFFSFLFLLFYENNYSTSRQCEILQKMLQSGPHNPVPDPSHFRNAGSVCNEIRNPAIHYLSKVKLPNFPNFKSAEKSNRTSVDLIPAT
jgi:hypothetical protein